MRFCGSSFLNVRTGCFFFVIYDRKLKSLFCAVGWTEGVIEDVTLDSLRNCGEPSFLRAVFVLVYKEVPDISCSDNYSLLILRKNTILQSYPAQVCGVWF